jgi:excisionase family DNA binding protein
VTWPAERNFSLRPEFAEVLDCFLDRLAVELADRVEARLKRLSVDRSAGAPQALDVKQAAARLGVSDRTMHALVVTSEVPSIKVGRRRLIAASTIDRLLVDGLPAAPGGIRRRADGTHRLPLSRAQ